jgi:plasmid maintenance system antidote protein VapI
MPIKRNPINPNTFGGVVGAILYSQNKTLTEIAEALGSSCSYLSSIINSREITTQQWWYEEVGEDNKTRLQMLRECPDWLKHSENFSKYFNQLNSRPGRLLANYDLESFGGIVGAIIDSQDQHKNNRREAAKALGVHETHLSKIILGTIVPTKEWWDTKPKGSDQTKLKILSEIPNIIHDVRKKIETAQHLRQLVPYYYQLKDKHYGAATRLSDDDPAIQIITKAWREAAGEVFKEILRIKCDDLVDVIEDNPNLMKIAPKILEGEHPIISDYIELGKIICAAYFLEDNYRPLMRDTRNEQEERFIPVNDPNRPKEYLATQVWKLGRLMPELLSAPR